MKNTHTYFQSKTDWPDLFQKSNQGEKYNFKFEYNWGSNQGIWMKTSWKQNMPKRWILDSLIRLSSPLFNVHFQLKVVAVAADDAAAVDRLDKPM